MSVDLSRSPAMGRHRVGAAVERSLVACVLRRSEVGSTEELDDGLSLLHPAANRS